MNIQRARQIAQSFSERGLLRVEAHEGGLLVRHHGHEAYFVRESCFWPYVSRLAGSAVGDVASIELKLAA